MTPREALREGLREAMAHLEQARERRSRAFEAWHAGARKDAWESARAEYAAAQEAATEAYLALAGFYG